MFCSKCGVPNADHASFCTDCGAPLLASQPTQVQPLVLPASLTQRFVHNIVDGFAMYLFAILIGVAGIVLFSETIGLVLGFIALLGYFFIFEAVFQKTVGKMFTGTKVVRVTGERPSMAALLGRSLARYIPFEPLSFLFYGSYPTKGWHDRVSGTLVVPQHLTPEQIRSIDPKKIAEQKPGGGASVVLVVAVGCLIILGIIGILTSVVIASLNSARESGRDAQVKSELANSKVQAEVYFDSHANSYLGFCNSSELKMSQSTLPGESREEFVCHDTVESFAIATSLRKGGYYCVDNTGAAIELVAPLGEKNSCGTETVQQSSWKNYDYPQDKFSISFPANPVMETQYVPPVDDSFVGYTYRMYSTKYKASTYLVSVYTYAEVIDVSEPESMLTTMAASLSGDGQLITSKYESKGQYPELEFTAKSGYEMMKGKVVLIGQTPLLVVYNYFPNNYSESDYEFFIQSLKLNE